MTKPTPHGQVPEALRLAHIFDNPLPPEWPDMVAAAAELRRQHARIAELEAVGAGGVQALSAAPAGWKLVPVNPTPEMWKAAKSVPDPNPPYPPHYGLVWDAMLAASPTPPVEQQTQPGAVYAELPEPDFGPGRYLGKATGDAYTKEQLRDFADRTHALRMQAAPKAAPGEREQAAQRLRELAGIPQDDVADPLHPRYIEGYKAGHAAGRKRAAPQPAPALPQC